MWVVIAVVVSVGCGRIAFDPRTDSDASTGLIDGQSDGVGPDGNAGSGPFVRSAQANDQSGTLHTTFAATFAVNTAGNTIVIAGGWGGGVSATIDDSAGNNYYTADGPIRETNCGYSIQIWYAANIVAATDNVVTLTYSAPSDSNRLGLHEYTGLDPTAPLEDTSSGTGVGIAMTSAPVVTTVPDQLVFGWEDSCSRDAAPDAGLEVREDFGRAATVELIATTPGIYSIDFTAVGSGEWSVLAATFR